MKEDNEKWLVNTPIDEFRRKFGFSGANPRTQEEINTITAISKKIDCPENCLTYLGAYYQWY